MKQQSQGKLLRIFMSENDRHEGRPLYEWIIRQADMQHLAGATVLRGLEGFGAHSHLHTAKVLRMSSDLPIIIEIADTEENINRFYSIIESVLEEGIVTIENIKITYFRKTDKPEKSS